MWVEKRLSAKGVSELAEPSYLELQAYCGGTKHMGGLKATGELIELCHIDKGKYVLDVGCGVGVTPCHIAEKRVCRVVGIDISQRMIDWSNRRAKRQGVKDRVEFRVADAQDLPFEDALFDVVIGESITTFIEDKPRAISEYVRVTKPGGYVGLNEETWIKAPPPMELVEYTSHMWDIDVEILTSDRWKDLFERSGLRDVVVRTCEFKGSLDEYIDGIRSLGVRDFLGMVYRFLSLYMRNSAVRKYYRERSLPPKNLWEYLGYGIYVGEK